MVTENHRGSHLKPFHARAPPDLLAGQAWRPIESDEERQRWKKILYMFILVPCLGACLYQVITLLTVFFQYQSMVIVSIKSAEHLTLPGITLCNSNSVTLKNLKNFTKRQKDPDAQAFGEKFDQETVAVEKQKLIDKYLRVVMDQPIRETVNLGPSFEEFVDKKKLECAFDAVGNLNYTCKSMVDPLATSQQIGNCFTLFHGSRQLKVEDCSIPPGYGQSPIIYGNDTDSLRVEVSDQPFQPNEIIRMQLNFRPDEYTSLNDPVYGTISIHDPTVSPDTRKRRYYVYPGHYYEFYITKNIAILLEAPYETKCFNYMTHNGPEYRNKNDSDRPHPYLDAPLSTDDCKIGCLARKAISECSCWPPELPFIGGFEERTTKRNQSFADLVACDWTKLSLQRNETALKTYSNCFASFTKMCEKECPQDCMITTFDVTVQSFEWPDKNRIESSNKKRKGELKNLKETTAVISIRYWTSDKIMNERTKKYEPIEFVSYVGGLVSMYMGFSFLGLYDNIVDWVVPLRRRFFGDKKPFFTRTF